MMSEYATLPEFEHLDLEDTAATTMAKLSHGNPGALVALGQVFKVSVEDGFLVALTLDGQGIYGSGIHVLFKDHCSGDVEKFVELVTSHKDLKELSTHYISKQEEAIKKARQVRLHRG
jgi:hypothetical protein